MSRTTTAAKSPAAVRVQIRPSNYRGKGGYLVTGSHELGFPVRIFVRHKKSAEQIRDILKSGVPLSTRAIAVDRVIRSEKQGQRHG